MNKSYKPVLVATIAGLLMVAAAGLAVMPASAQTLHQAIPMGVISWQETAAL